MKSKLFLLASSEGIGGAESRTMKFANYAAENLNWDVNLVINQSLFSAVQENALLNELISHPKLTVVVYRPFLNRIVSEGFRNKLLKDRKAKRVFKFIPPLLVRALTWFRFLKKNVTRNDVVHCIFGDTARLGCYFYSNVYLNVPVIVEITSNRHVNTWGRHINLSLKNRSEKSRLYINCVSDTVKSNLLPQVKSGFHTIIRAYSGPFMLIPKEEGFTKENVILFAHRFIPPKNPVIFAEAIKEVYIEGYLEGWTVFIRGRGSLESKIEEILQPLIDQGMVKLGYTNSLIEESKISKIFVSIISTGNYPSQSLFESMRYGSLLVLSDRGVTKEKIGEAEGIHYVNDISITEVKGAIIKAIVGAKKENYIEQSMDIEKIYEGMVAQNGYINDVLEIYSKGR